MGSTIDKAPLRLDTVYCLGPSWATRYYWAQVPDGPDDLIGIERGEVTPSSPVALTIDSGGRPGDFIWNSHSLVVASPRALTLLRQEHLSGFDTYAVRVRLGNRVLPGYRGVSIVGRAGALDQARSHVVRFPRKGGGISKIEGLYFDPATWDGSDFFCLQDFFVPLITERVREALGKGKIANFRATPLHEFRFG